jgi:hypothetical protein
LGAAPEEEYWKWFLFGPVLLAIPLITDMILVPVILFSLERRMTRAKVWILSVWTFGLAGSAFLAALWEGLKFAPI